MRSTRFSSGSRSDTRWPPRRAAAPLPRPPCSTSSRCAITEIRSGEQSRSQADLRELSRLRACTRSVRVATIDGRRDRSSTQRVEDLDPGYGATLTLHRLSDPLHVGSNRASAQIETPPRSGSNATSSTRGSWPELHEFAATDHGAGRPTPSKGARDGGIAKSALGDAALGLRECRGVDAIRRRLQRGLRPRPTERSDTATPVFARSFSMRSRSRRASPIDPASRFASPTWARASRQLQLSALGIDGRAGPRPRSTESPSSNRICVISPETWAATAARCFASSSPDASMRSSRSRATTGTTSTGLPGSTIAAVSSPQARRQRRERETAQGEPLPEQRASDLRRARHVADLLRSPSSMTRNDASRSEGSSR